MEIKMKTYMAGPDGSAGPGQIIDASTEQGRALIDGGYAEEVNPPQETAVIPPVEYAVVHAPENAAIPRKGRGKGK